MNEIVKQIDEVIDGKRSVFEPNFDFDDMESLDVFYRIIFKYFTHNKFTINNDFIEFAESTQSWSMFNNFEIYHCFNKIEPHWLTEEKMLNLTSASVYRILLSDMKFIYPIEFINHYHNIKDDNNRIIYYLIMSGLDYRPIDNTRLKLALEFVKMYTLSPLIPYVSPLEVESYILDDAYLELMSDFSDSVEQTVKIQCIIDYLISQNFNCHNSDVSYLTKTISNNYCLLTITQKISFMNSLKQLTEAQLFVLFLDTHDNEFIDEIFDYFPVVNIQRSRFFSEWYDYGITIYFAQKLLDHGADRNIIIISLLRNSDTTEMLPYIHQHEIICAIESVIEKKFD